MKLRYYIFLLWTMSSHFCLSSDIYSDIFPETRSKKNNITMTPEEMAQAFRVGAELLNFNDIGYPVPGQGLGLESVSQSKLSQKMNRDKNLDILLNRNVNIDRLSFEKPTGIFHVKNRKDWTSACLAVPKNIAILAGVEQQSAFLQHPDIINKSAAWNDFELCLHTVCDAYRYGQLAHTSAWTKKGYPSQKFYNVKDATSNKIVEVFEPYVQKLTLQPGQRVLFHGDIHGDIHSLITLVTWLENRGFLDVDSFKLRLQDTYLVFLGDYIDYGYYGAEVLYTLMRLKIANPEHVILLRGNHEDVTFRQASGYSFLQELGFKFRPDYDVVKLTQRLFNFMPVALYLGHGDDYIVCSHSGIEHGYNPTNLLQDSAQFDLLGRLSRSDCLAADDYAIGYMMSDSKNDTDFHWMHSELAEDFIPEDLGHVQEKIGFLWFEFAKHGKSLWNPHTGLVSNEKLTKAILEYYNKDSQKKVRALFRSHQHALHTDRNEPTNLMGELRDSKGIYSLWKPIETSSFRSLDDSVVWTCNVTPDSIYGLGNGFVDHSFVMMRIAEKYNKWELSVYNIAAISQKKIVLPGLPSKIR